MASPLPYAPYRTPVVPGPTTAYSDTTDPRKLVANARAITQERGDALQSQDQQLADQYAQQASGVQSYLNDIQDPLAKGQGGYSGTESDNINLSPEARAQIQLSGQDRQNIITGAGISAGAGTASAVGAAERAAAATGGNPAALAAYRARAAQTQGAQAGDAMTQARIGAQQAGSQGAQAAQQLGSQGAQAVGNARIGQQNQALGYFNGLQGQANTSAQNEQGLQQGAYGTQTSGTTSDAKTGVEAQQVANQTPSTLDKILSGAGAVAGALKLAEGTSGYLDEGTDAVVAENGPEAIVEAASDPVRSHTTFMDNGVVGGTPDPNQSLGHRIKGALDDYLSNPAKQPSDTEQPASGQGTWNKTTPYKEFGAGVGKLLSKPTPPAQGVGSVPGPGSSPGQLPGGQTMNVPYRAPDPARMPGGMINRTGSPIDGTPSQGMDMAPSSAAGPGLDVAESAAPIADAIPAAAEGLGAAAEAVPAAAEGIGAAFLGNGYVGGYRARPMAGGGFGVPHAPRIITTPTHVHLNKGDAVVPLSYRPEAKVRPSFALNAAMSSTRHPYGARRGA